MHSGCGTSAVFWQLLYTALATRQVVISPDPYSKAAVATSWTLALFFLSTYSTQWTTFFADLFALMRPASSSASSSNAVSFNTHVSLLFFHIVLEISGEVAVAAWTNLGATISKLSVTGRNRA